MGIRCSDCGAFLQVVQMGGAEFLRCPWANPDVWSVALGEPTQIHCNWPLGAPRSSTGLYAAANPAGR